MRTAIKVLIGLCVLIGIQGSAIIYVYTQGVEDGHTQGSDEMSKEWIDGCTKGMTLELDGITIACYEGVRA
jgi:hypothetical protein